MREKVAPVGDALARRAFLTAATSTLGSMALSACGGSLPGTPVPDLDRSRPIVDAHAHVFNAKDLPGFPFLHEVYIQRYTGVFLEPLMPLFKAYADRIERAAPGFQEEQEAMLRRRASEPAEPLLDDTLKELENGTLPDAGPKENQQRIYRDLLELVAPAPPAPASAVASPESVPAAASAPSSAAQQRRQLTNFLLSPSPAARTPDVGLESVLPSAPAPVASSRGPYARFADQIRQLFAWFSSFKEYRRERIEAWNRFIAVDGPRFVMPAIVDFGFSLRDVNHTTVPIDQQVQLMGELSRRQPLGRLLHGYVPFNPVRFARDPIDATAAIDNAVQNQGFVGVKLYPPMGYQASGNSKISMRYFGYLNIANLGERIDSALNWVYDYCLENDLTILVHSAPSNSPHANPYDGWVVGTEDWSRRPNPDFWSTVLADRPGLRVLFGHFGGAYRVSRNRAWVDKIVDLMMAYPNVYGDFSDYDLVLDETQPQRSSRRDLKQYLQQLDTKKREKLQQRLVFGSDWEMLDLIVGIAPYTRNMLGFLTEALGGRTEDYAACNALRMIGLDNPGSKTSERLAACRT